MINPCLDCDLTIENKAITKNINVNALKPTGIDRINKLPKAIIDNTARSAEAKFGFPSVEIMLLYGLFQSTKSLPKICRIP